MNHRPDSVSEKLFFRELLARKQTVDYYKDEALLEYATEFVPIEELKIKAALWLSMQPDDCGLELDDAVLLELLRWFKEAFFKWMDAPRCTHCNVVTQKKGGVLAPTEEEIEWGVSTVEHFACPVCERIYRFPRYNHPKKLLETRQGRCGEWANCFTFLCVALEFDARLVFDWTDHVWTEVYSESQKRWIHCDPCENVCDRPLMYEVGWNKKLSYVIAFSDKEVQDVTWRYTANFTDVLERRTLCREDFLLDSIVFLQEKLAENLSRKEQKLLISRRARELAEFLSPPKPDGENSYGGRTSGSLAWRLARGEAGPAHCQTSYVFKLRPEEIEQRLLRVQYSCALDRYVRNGEESTQPGGWTACAFRHSNVFRKVEGDWKMVYLARTEGSQRGNVAWKFDFRESGLVIHKIKLNLYSETFHSGKVEWLMHADSEKPLMKVYPPESVRCLETVDFSGSKGFVLSATLSNGTSWQHSQLFRQPLDSRTFPFDVEVHFSANK